MSEKVTVEFQADYIATRGAPISGAKGAVKTYPMTDDLKKCLEEGTVKIVKEGAAEKREKATAKKDAEKS